MARCLSFHQNYRCARSGVCCTSHWPIPVEADRLARIQAAIATGALRARVGPDELFLAAAPAPSEPAILATTHSGCVFYDATGDRGCRIQSAIGHDALPLSCRQFPRVTVVDPRGASVVLSLYCPTAARMLDQPGQVSIVDSPGAFPDDGEYVGLDARTAWPPILRAGVLMDWESWWTFERRAVNLIANVSANPEDALARVSAVVARVQTWNVDDGPLRDWIERAFDGVIGGAVESAPMAESLRRLLVRKAHDRIPEEWRPASEPQLRVTESVPRHLRYLACHAFGNWDVHLGTDLGAWLEAIRTAHALVASGFTVGEADLRLRHLGSHSSIEAAGGSSRPA